ELDEVEIEVYEELMRMRSDYLSRGDHEHVGAFAALERAFLSSAQAFAAAAHAILEADGAARDSDIFALEAGDGTLAFMQRSGYFKRRLRRLRERLGARLGAGAPLSGKEAALLAVLSENKKRPVVILCQYRATAARISTV